MFKLTGTKRVAEFAIQLADDFIRLCPAGSKKAQPYVTRVVNDLCKRASEFQASEKLGTLGKARLGTEFKHRLLEQGYTPQLVDDLTAKLLTQITRS